MNKKCRTTVNMKSNRQKKQSYCLTCTGCNNINGRLCCVMQTMSLRQCESKLFLPQYLTPVRVLLHARWSDYLVKVHNRFVSVKITGPIVYDCGVSGIRISDANYCHCALPLFQGTEALPCSCADITDMHTHAVEEQRNQSKYSKFQLGANT